jgi:hypothetical protein
LQADAVTETSAAGADCAANAAAPTKNVADAAVTETPIEGAGGQSAALQQAETQEAAAVQEHRQAAVFDGKIVLGHKRERAEGEAYPFKTGQEYDKHRSRLITEAVTGTEETANAQPADIAG